MTSSVKAPGIYDLPDEVYHADPCPQPSLSASIAKVMLARSPRHAWIQHQRLNPQFQHDDDSKYDMGTAAHEIVLRGIDRVRIIEAKDWRTKDAKAERDKARQEGLIPLLRDNYLALSDMVTECEVAIRQCPDLSGMTLKDGMAEQTVIWQEGGAWCRSKMDWIANDHSLILDYKTAGASAEPDSWIRTNMVTNGADVQGAFYLRGVEAVAKTQPKFVFVVQEIDPPYAVSFIGYSPAFRALGDDKVNQALDLWQHCLATGQWPAYPRRICWPDPPAWAQAQHMEKAMRFDQLQEREGMQA
ncbi:MAG: PD-(D/E)XK nuclease-like domain-containing protein [Gemmatimonadota bacterium]|jgi:hypothetical protein